MDGEDLKKLRIVMKKYLPLDAVLAAIEKMKDSVPHYITMAEKGAYIDCVNDAVDKIHSLEAKEVDLELITGWFDHIAQIADDRKTANGEVMEDWAALDEIKCLAKESSEFIRTHCNAQKEVVHIVDEDTGNLFDVEIDKTKSQKGE